MIFVVKATVLFTGQTNTDYSSQQCPFLCSCRLYGWPMPGELNSFNNL